MRSSLAATRAGSLDPRALLAVRVHVVTAREDVVAARDARRLAAG